MLFNISHLVTVPQAYVMLEASSSTATASSSPSRPSSAWIRPRRSEPADRHPHRQERHRAHAGQTYQLLTATVGGAAYTAGAGQKLEDTGAVIGLEKGVEDDLFFLSFEHIGTNSRRGRIRPCRRRRLRWT